MKIAIRLRLHLCSQNFCYAHVSKHIILVLTRRTVQDIIMLLRRLCSST